MLDRKLREYRSNNAISVCEYICVNCDLGEEGRVARKKRCVTEKSVRQDECTQRTPSDEITKGATALCNNNANNAVENENIIPEILPSQKSPEPSKKNPESRVKKKSQTTVKKKTAKNSKDKESNEKNTAVDEALVDVHLIPNQFDIILLVDTQETSAGKTKPQHDATLVELSELGVLFEVRHLKVGDFAWIARCRLTNKELVLPYIAERKRIDDLSASIRDGRFHEQKFRLKQSGIDNLIYIVESYDRNTRLTIPHSSLMQAAVNSLVQEKFNVKYTRSHKDSMFYLSSLTRILIKVFKEKTLIGSKKEHIAPMNILRDTISLMEFNEFNKAASKQKTFKVNQMFVRQLLQLNGISVEKALAIVERYPTPKVLVNALNNVESNGELLLASIQFGNKKRLIGPSISKTIYQLYTQKDFN